MGGISDFGDGEFYGFSAIANREKGKFKKNYRKKLKAMNIPLLWGDTDEWKEANAKLEEKEARIK